MGLEQEPDEEQAAWENSPTKVGLYLIVAFVALRFGLVVPVALIAAAYVASRKLELSRIHAALGAIVFGGSLSIVAAALLAGDPGLLARGAIDIAVPAILYASYLTGTFALGRNCAWILWLLAAFETYAVIVQAAMAATHPSGALFFYIATHVAAIVAAGLIIFGPERLGSPSLDLFD